MDSKEESTPQPEGAVVEDLSEYSAPISAFLGSEKSYSEEAWKKYALSEEQLKFYEESGYLEGVNILSETQLKQLQSDTMELMNPENPKHKLWHEYNRK